MSPLSPFIRFAAEIAAATFAPERCAACDVIVRLRRVFCPSCAATVHRSDDPRGGAPADVACAAPFVYGGAIADGITRFKYGRRTELARPLADLLKHAVPMLSVPDVVVPVPLHPSRLAERGFNQAALLARPLAKEFGARFSALTLARVRDTPKQATLDKAARGPNVLGAFVVRRRANVTGLSVLLVDDVCTTGSTLAACANALRDAGAREVECAVIARAE